MVPNKERRPLGKDGALEIALGNGDTKSITAAAVIPLLALSDERDLWMKRLLDEVRDAYLRGYEDGRADQARKDDGVWAAQSPLKVAVVPSHAELELARYAREHFGDQRPGDRLPRKERAA